MRAPVDANSLWDPLDQDTSEGKGRHFMAKRTLSSARIVALPDAADDAFRERSYLMVVKLPTADQGTPVPAIDAHTLTLAVGPAATGKTCPIVTAVIAPGFPSRSAA